MSAALKLTIVPDTGVGELIGDKPALIPPGKYHLRMTHWQTAIMWGRSRKLILHFTVCDMGHCGVKLERYYNIERIIGNPAINGRFKASWRSDLMHEYCTLLPPPLRPDRICLERLKPLLIVGNVKTVTANAKQKRIPDALHYSVVSELLHVEAGARP